MAILLIVVEGAAAFEPLISSGKLRELVDTGAIPSAEAARTIAGEDYVRAMQARRLIQQEFAKVFETFDLLVSPAMPILATPLAQKLEEAFAYSDPLGAGGNVAGLPALSVPCGFLKAGLPAGLQIVGPPLAERRILALGKRYQQATD